MAKLVKRVPPQPQTERGSFCFISCDKPGERILYSHGTDVLWRPVKGIVDGSTTPEDIFVWRNHLQRVTCVSMSPNGNYVASGDVQGSLKVWGANGEHVQKHDLKLWDGMIKEVFYSGDSTRIVAAGDGKSMRAVAMLADTGSKTGDVQGHAKQVNSISFKSTRPFRCVTGGEDCAVIFHQGPPFKHLKEHAENHTQFVNCVRYSPDGNWVVSAGSDSALFLYEGKDGLSEGSFEAPAGITGSLWRAEWSPDSTKVATAGGDKKLRIWDRESKKQLAEAKVGAAALEDMQVGLSWASDTRLLSVCLDGRILVWDLAADGSLTLAGTQDGTQGALSAVAIDAQTGAILRGGVDGCVVVEQPDGKAQKAKVGKMIGHILAHSAKYSGPAEAWVFSIDAKARKVNLQDGTLGDAVSLEEKPLQVFWMDEAETKVLIATTKNSVICLGPGGIEWRKEKLCPRDPTAVGYLPGQILALGMEKPEGSVAGVEHKNFDIALFDVKGDSADGLVQSKILANHFNRVTAISFSSAGDLMASADVGGQITVWDPASFEVKTKLLGHTSSVNAISWWPGSNRLVSGSLDTSVIVWNVDDTKNKVALKELHKGGVAAIAAFGENSFASVGADGFMLVHEV